MNSNQTPLQFPQARSRFILQSRTTKEYVRLLMTKTSQVEWTEDHAHAFDFGSRECAYKAASDGWMNLARTMILVREADTEGKDVGI